MASSIKSFRLSHLPTELPTGFLWTKLHLTMRHPIWVGVNNADFLSSVANFLTVRFSAFLQQAAVTIVNSWQNLCLSLLCCLNWKLGSVHEWLSSSPWCFALLSKHPGGDHLGPVAFAKAFCVTKHGLVQCKHQEQPVVTSLQPFCHAQNCDTQKSKHPAISFEGQRRHFVKEVIWMRLCWWRNFSCKEAKAKVDVAKLWQSGVKTDMSCKHPSGFSQEPQAKHQEPTQGEARFCRCLWDNCHTCSVVGANMVKTLWCTKFQRPQGMFQGWAACEQNQTLGLPARCQTISRECVIDRSNSPCFRRQTLHDNQGCAISKQSQTAKSVNGITRQPRSHQWQTKPNSQRDELKISVNGLVRCTIACGVTTSTAKRQISKDLTHPTQNMWKWQGSTGLDANQLHATETGCIANIKFWALVHSKCHHKQANHKAKDGSRKSNHAQAGKSNLKHKTDDHASDSDYPKTLFCQNKHGGCSDPHRDTKFGNPATGKSTQKSGERHLETKGNIIWRQRKTLGDEERHFLETMETPEMLMNFNAQQCCQSWQFTNLGHPTCWTVLSGSIGSKKTSKWKNSVMIMMTAKSQACLQLWSQQLVCSSLCICFSLHTPRLD